MASYFDWLVTLDPHLHRHAGLGELYRIPTFVARSAPHVARWLERLDADPVLIGPDAESEQWVSAVAAIATCPFLIFDKTRHGDRDVEIADVEFGEADLGGHHRRVPVILDDIISTGTTMVETIDLLDRAGFKRPICVGIHGVFADGASSELVERAERVLTCNSIPHPTNAIDITPALAEQITVALAHTPVGAAG